MRVATNTIMIKQQQKIIRDLINKTIDSNIIKTMSNKQPIITRTLKFNNIINKTLNKTISNRTTNNSTTSK